VSELIVVQSPGDMAGALRRMRESRGRTVEEVASSLRAAGVNLGAGGRAITRYENGVSVPHLENALRIGADLGYTLAFLRGHVLAAVQPRISNPPHVDDFPGRE
jgi:transcriptional regulator with XRE-family HTH domain